jgi:hypothetical protein
MNCIDAVGMGDGRDIWTISNYIVKYDIKLIFKKIYYISNQVNINFG